MPNLPMHTVNLPGIDNPIELVDKQGREDLATLEQEVIAITPPENIDISSDGVKVMSDYDLNELGWGVQDDDYYFTTTAEFSLGDRTYTKENAKPALGAVVGTPNGMNNRQIVLVSTDAEATYFGWGSYHNRQGTSFTYLGHTWYYSGGNAAYYGTPASGIGVIDDDTLSLEDAAKYLIDVSVVYFDDGVFSAITEPNSGYLLAGGGSQADYSDAKFTVSKTGIVTAVDIVVNTESLPIAIHRVRDNECKAYYPSSTYNTGDRVIYLNQYYKCKEDGVTGAWNYSKWEAWTLDKEIESVREEVENLPNPMIFKGTLGTSGTIQDLPTASSANEGFTYKVIEDGTYGSVPAKAGDVFVSNGSVWILIPAGDDVEDTWRNVKVNGVEKLTSLISSGAIDFINGTNTEVVFDENNNTLQINAVDTTYPTLSQEDATAGVSETASTITAKVLKTTVDDAVADKSVTKTATGNPIELTDAASAPMVKCVTEIQGSQDLHGYDKPWVGGAGKNKFDGTIYNSAYTDADFNLGTTAPTIQKSIKLYLQAGTYTISFIPPSLGVTYRIIRRLFDGGYNTTHMENITHYTFTTTIDGYVGLSFRHQDNSVWDNENIQIESGSTPTSYAPYSNICPITAYTEGEIEVSGRNLYPIKIGNDSFAPNAGGSASNDNGTLVVTATSTSYSGVYTATNSTFYNMTEGLVGKFTYSFYAKSSVNLRAVLGITNYGRGEFDLTPTWQRISMTGTFPGTKLPLLIYSRATAGTIYIKDFMLERGDTSHDYEEYIAPTTHTTTLSDEVYRGEVDYAGGSETHDMVLCDLSDLTWTYNAGYDLWVSNGVPNGYKAGSFLVAELYPYVPTLQTTGTEYGIRGNQNYNLWCRNYDSVNAPSGMLAYELATPTTTPVTPTNLPIKSLSGYNHIESSTGDMEIEYITEEYQPLVDLIEDAVELPAVTSLDDGKVLTVVDGKWVAASLPVGQNIQY